MSEYRILKYSNMFTSKFIHWSGLVLMLAGVFMTVPTVLHSDEIAESSAMLSASWVPVHTAFILGVVLSILGLIGLYLRQLEKGGYWGTIGFALTVVGTVLTVAVLTIDAYVVPVMAADASAQALLDPAGPLFNNGPLGLEFLLAARLGVTILTGTDEMPPVRPADEVTTLHHYGLPIAAALSAASVNARTYFGLPNFENGAPADFVAFETDPRRNLETLARPAAVILGGRRAR